MISTLVVHVGLIFQFRHIYGSYVPCPSSHVWPGPLGYGACKGYFSQPVDNIFGFATDRICVIPRSLGKNKELLFYMYLLGVVLVSC